MNDQPTTPPMPEAGGGPFPPPTVPPMPEPGVRASTAAAPVERPTFGRTRQIAAVAAVAAGVAITAGIAVAAGDDTATDDATATVADDAATATDALPALDADRSTDPVPQGDMPDLGEMPELGAEMPEHSGRGGHGQRGDTPAFDRTTDAGTATPGQMPQGGAPDASSQGS